MSLAAHGELKKRFSPVTTGRLGQAGSTADALINNNFRAAATAFSKARASEATSKYSPLVVVESFEFAQKPLAFAVIGVGILVQQPGHYVVVKFFGLRNA